MAGFRGSVLVERADGQPMTEAQEALARGIVEHHEDKASDAEISRAVGAYLSRQKPPAGEPSAEQPPAVPTLATPPDLLARTGTGGE
jgi:hypothetical protein